MTFVNNRDWLRNRRGELWTAAEPIDNRELKELVIAALEWSHPDYIARRERAEAAEGRESHFGRVRRLADERQAAEREAADRREAELDKVKAWYRVLGHGPAAGSVWLLKRGTRPLWWDVDALGDFRASEVCGRSGPGSADMLREWQAQKVAIEQGDGFLDLGRVIRRFEAQAMVPTA